MRILSMFPFNWCTCPAGMVELVGAGSAIASPIFTSVVRKSYYNARRFLVVKHVVAPPIFYIFHALVLTLFAPA